MRLQLPLDKIQNLLFCGLKQSDQSSFCQFIFAILTCIVVVIYLTNFSKTSGSEFRLISCEGEVEDDLETEALDTYVRFILEEDELEQK